MKMDECCTTNVRPSALLPIGFQTDTNNLVRSVNVSYYFLSVTHYTVGGKNFLDEETKNLRLPLQIHVLFN